MAKMKWESEHAFPVLGRPDDLVIQDSQREQLAFFVCDAVDSPRIRLHSASTLEADEKVRECAFLLKDNNLFAKLSAGDLIAIVARYHENCLVGLYNRARQSNSPTTKRAAKSQVT